MIWFDTFADLRSVIPMGGWTLPRHPFTLTEMDLELLYPRLSNRFETARYGHRCH